MQENYKLVFGHTAPILVERVNEAISEGWRPQGGINHYTMYAMDGPADGGTRPNVEGWAQAMVRQESFR